MDPEVPSDLLQRRLGIPTSSNPNNILSELSRQRLRHSDILSARSPGPDRSAVT